MQIIIKHKIRKNFISNQFNLSKINIFVPANMEINRKLMLNNVGDTAIPAPTLGKTSNINANGWYEKDKKSKKERRYVNTIWQHPYGNRKIPEQPIDIYRECYKKIFHNPYEIKFQMRKNRKKETFICAILENGFQDNIVHIINLFIEIAGICYISDCEDFLETKCNIYNWKFLPTGQLPHKFLSKILKQKRAKNKTYDIHRLEVLDNYQIDEIGQGINGFEGYFAYIFKKCCAFESPIYGNATYIVASDNWKELSKMSKKELFEKNFVIEKIIHDSSWENKIRKVIKQIENQ